MELSGTMLRVAGTAMEAGVPRDRIRQIRLVLDTVSRYPFARFLIGFVLVIVAGLGLVVLLFTSPRESLPIDSRSGQVTLNLVPTTLWLMAALGLWSLAGVFRTSYQLEVETDEGTTRIVLGTSAELPSIRQFVRMANWSFGYEIDTSVLDGAGSPP